jgi:Flp pilus assembly protein TadD
MAAARAANVPAATIAAMENQLARTYSQLKQPVQAEATLQKSLEEDPNNFNTYALLGAIYAQQNSFPQAQAAFTQAVAKNPASPGMWTLLGILDEQLHQPAQGEQAYLKALALDPNNGVANNNLASLYADRAGDLDQALVLAQRAKRALPTIPNVSDTLGWIYVKQGVYQLAIPLLQQAVAAQPKAGDFRYHLGAALYGAGRKPEARAQLDQAVHLDQGLGQQADVQRMLRN